MEGSPITRGRGELRKTTGENIKRDLDFSSLNINLSYNKIL